MGLFIERLKISNFLSFWGEYEVKLKPFSAVMCNFYEGKDDLCRAFEFVFGAKLADLRVGNPLDLVHKVLREEFLINRDVNTFVEVTLNLRPDNKKLEFCRSVKKGASNPRIEHKISGLVTSKLLYEEKLNSLGVFIQKKNLIFYKSYFNNVIWGSAEDLEMTINTCLREDYLLEDWRKANKEVEHLTRLKNLTLEKNYNSMKKSHFVLHSFTKKYELFSSNRESTAEKILQDFANGFSHESTPSLRDSSEEENPAIDVNERAERKLSMGAKIELLMEELNDLKLKEAVLTSRLYHEEIKLSAKPVNASILQNRISQIKSELQEKENQMSEIWENIRATKSKLENLDQRISLALISLQEIHRTTYSQNRFTPYGRFYDYLHPSHYLQLLKHIVGNEIFYAHLCDSVEDASTLLKQIRDLKYEHREVLIPFENYSHKLKDLIIASGEGGIQINSLEELLIFLCKLKQYQFIDEVPVIGQNHFDYESVPDDYTIYIQNDIHFTTEGLISYKAKDESDFILESEEELKQILVQLYATEEMQYHKWQDLLFLKWETLLEMNSLENDLFCLKRKWRKSTQKLNLEGEPLKLTEIYEDYCDIFKEHDEERKKFESESQEEESFFSEGDSSAPSNEDLLRIVNKDLEDVLFEKRKIKKLLEEMINEMRSLDVTVFYVQNLKKNFTVFHKNVDQKKLLFEEEFKKLKKLMKENDLEDFLGNQEWRKAFITSLVNDLREIKNKLKDSTERLQNIASERKRRLYQLFEHCSCYLSSTFSHILDGTLPFVKLNFTSGEEKIHIMSCFGEEKINVVDIKHFNTLIKFVSTLCMFLEISNFDKIPIMILDDIEEYLPIYDDDLKAALDEDILEKILPERKNQRFHLLARLGQFLRHYIKKNIPTDHIRNNGNYNVNTNGPMQIIYFVTGDLAHSADHCIWIQNQILPEEYLTEKCNSYSKIHEINFHDIDISKQQ